MKTTKKECFFCGKDRDFEVKKDLDGYTYYQCLWCGVQGVHTEEEKPAFNSNDLVIEGEAGIILVGCSPEVEDEGEVLRYEPRGQCNSFSDEITLPLEVIGSTYYNKKTEQQTARWRDIPVVARVQEWEATVMENYTGDKSMLRTITDYETKDKRIEDEKGNIIMELKAEEYLF